MTDESTAAEEIHDRNVVELFVAIVLGAAALLTAYAAYYGSLAGGDALQGYTQATITRGEANSDYSDYSQSYSSDQSTFLQYQVKLDEGEADVAQNIRDSLFSPELEAATVAWEADNQGFATPLGVKEYVVESYNSYLANDEAATKAFDDAQKTDDQGDNFDLASVFLAVSLFFAGVAGLMRSRKVSYALLIGAVVLFVPGIWAISKGKGWVS
jgi:hypothetical protein